MMRCKYATYAFCLFGMIALASCGRFSNQERADTQADTQADTSNREQRIVSVSKQINEIMYALGAEDHLVGVDVSSTYPPTIKKLPTVGYHRALGSEGIISLHPTAVYYSTHGIAPQSVVEQIRKVGIPLKEYSSTSTLGETKDLIRTLGQEFDAEHRADSLCNKLDADMERAHEAVKKYEKTPRVAIIHYGQQMNIYLLVTGSSTAGKMLEWAGGENSVHAEGGMTPLSAERLAKANPDVILVTNFGYDRLSSLNKIKRLPGIGATKAAQNDRIYRIEEHDLIYLGPRTGENVLDIMQMIHAS